VPQAQVLLDTNIAIYLATGHTYGRPYYADLEDKLRAISFITAAELLFTARKSAQPERKLAYWREHLPRYIILFPDLQTCDIWADIAAKCHAKGAPRQDNDLWVAATALRYNLPLVTHNRRDFDDIAGLTIISHG
jgi:tRNA(fMet)-specific endonuclease VapC